MPDQPGQGTVQYGVEQALRECLEDMAGVRKQVADIYRPENAPSVEALIKLRAEALQLLILRARLVAARQAQAQALVPTPEPTAADDATPPEAKVPEPAAAGKDD